MLPNFLIVGAQKAGTSSMVIYLSEHPDVSVPLNEIHFFDIDERYKKGLKWYEKHFKKWNGQKAIGEKTPIYMYLEKVPARIAKDLPNIKLIFMLRNPTDRAWSNYWMRVRKGREFLSFREVLDKQTFYFSVFFQYCKIFYIIWEE